MESSTAAYQEMVSNYASVGGLAVLTWDILDNIPEDYRILFVNQPKRLSIPAIIYMFSRLGAFAYGLISVILETAPVGHCTTINLIALAWCPISIGATSLLFFLRLRAIYNRNRIIILIFFVLWLAVLVGAALAPIGSTVGPLVGPGHVNTGYCEEVSVTAVSYYGQNAPLVYDTLVWLAISWRLSRISKIYEPTANVGKSMKAMLFGTDLPTFTRSLLIDGQIYYLITVVIGIARAVLIFSPVIPLPVAGLLEDVYPVVVNIMACRLYRRTKSGAIRESEISSSVVNQRNYLAPIQFAADSGSFTGTGSKEGEHTI